MERLTKRITENQIELSEKANKPQHYSPIIHIKHPFWTAFDKLAEYEDAEEQGLLVKVIRCKDCKYFSGGGLWSKGHWCGRTAIPGVCVHVTENDFCSMAEQALAKMKGV